MNNVQPCEHSESEIVTSGTTHFCAKCVDNSLHAKMVDENGREVLWDFNREVWVYADTLVDVKRK